MRILHVELGRHLYGGALQVVYLLRGLKQLSVESHLVCTSGSEIARAAAGTAIVHEIDNGGDLDLRFPVRLAGVVRRVRPDLVHVHSRRGADTWGGLVAGRYRVPAVVTRRVDNPEPAWWARWKYRRYARVVTISEGIREVVLRSGVPSGAVTCVRSAVDPAPYRHVGETEWFRREFGIAPDERTMAVIAQLIPRKGHIYLLRALPQILAAHPRLKVLFFGKGPGRGDLERERDSLGLDHQVQFAGFRTDLERILPCLDLVVHPALMEGLGVSLLQAASAGVPIVAAAAGGIPEVVRDGVNGLLVAPADSDGLAAAIIRLLGDDGLRRSFGGGGQRLVADEFSLDVMVRGNLAVYSELLANRRDVAGT